MRWLLIVLTILAAVLLPSGVAGAAQTAQGDFTVSPPVVTSARPTDDGGCIIDQSPAQQSFTATGTFTGTVAGASGTFDSMFQGSIDPEGNARGQLAILSGTGGLSSLHGHLTLTGQAGVGGTYTGTIDFGP